MKTYGESLVAALIRNQHEMTIKFHELINKESPMKTYIGIKAVQAEPCHEQTFYPEREIKPTNGDPLAQGRPGYRVTYSDGYTSWSPKEAFEAAYVEVPEESAEEILVQLRAELDGYVMVSGEQQDAGPTHSTFPIVTFGKDAEQWAKDEREQHAIERRSLAISYALQSTQPVYMGQSLHSSTQSVAPRPRTLAELIDAATQILAFMEGAKSEADKDAAVESSLRQHGRRVDTQAEGY